MSNCNTINDIDEITNNLIKQKTEHFGWSWGWGSLVGIIWFVAFVFAIYLSFRCHGGFDFWSFLVAFFCPWIYIIYVLATKSNLCKYYGPIPVKIH